MNRLTRLVLKRPVTTLLAVLCAGSIWILITDHSASGAYAGYGDADEDRIYCISGCRFRVCG